MLTIELKVKVYSDLDLTHRKPMLVSLLSGDKLLRLETRKSRVFALKEPPRNTRTVLRSIKYATFVRKFVVNTFSSSDLSITSMSSLGFM